MADEKNIVVFRDVVYLDGDLWRVVKNELINKDNLTDTFCITKYPLYERKSNGAVAPNNLLS